MHKAEKILPLAKRGKSISENDPDMTEVTEWPNKTTKTAIADTLLYKKMEEKMNLRRRDFKRAQLEILDIKSTIFQMKYTPGGVEIRLDTSGEKDWWTWRHSNRNDVKWSTEKEKKDANKKCLECCWAMG